MVESDGVGKKSAHRGAARKMLDLLKDVNIPPLPQRQPRYHNYHNQMTSGMGSNMHHPNQYPHYTFNHSHHQGYQSIQQQHGPGGASAYNQHYQSDWRGTGGRRNMNRNSNAYPYQPKVSERLNSDFELRILLSVTSNARLESVQNSYRYLRLTSKGVFLVRDILCSI